MGSMSDALTSQRNIQYFRKDLLILLISTQMKILKEAVSFAAYLADLEGFS